MSSQNDFIAGFDFSGLTSVTQEQLMQAINQLAFVSNIAGIVAQSTTPDVVNNARFANYLWLDTTTAPAVMKLYDSDDSTWSASTISAASVTTAMMAPASATGGISVPLLKRATNGGADASKRYYLLRVDSAGQYIEVVLLSTAITDGGGVTLAMLDTTGIADTKFLGSSSGTIAWQTVPSAAITNLAVTSLAPGTATYLLRTNAGGTTVEWASIADAIPIGSLTLDKLDDHDAALGLIAAQYDVVTMGSSSKWIASAPMFHLAYDNNLTLTGFPSATYGTPKVFNHGLTLVPKLVVVTAKCITTEGNYAADDEIAIESICRSDGAIRAFHISWNATSVFVNLPASFGNTSTVQALNKTSDAAFTLTPAKWALRVRAWI